MTVLDKLQLAREARRLVRVVRTPERAHELQGYVAGFGAWMLLANEEGLALNGYSLVPLSQVAELSFFPPESDYARACRRKNLHLQVRPLPDVDLRDDSSLFQSLRRRGEAVVIESEHEHSDAFLVGQILRVYRSSAVIARADAAGALESVEYRAITRIGAGDSYCAHYSAVPGRDSGVLRHE